MITCGMESGCLGEWRKKIRSHHNEKLHSAIITQALPPAHTADRVSSDDSTDDDSDAFICPERKILVMKFLRITKFLSKDVNLETITDTSSWYKI